MYTEKKMSKMLLSLASLMVLVVVSAAQAQPPLPPGLEQEVRACLAGGVGVCAPYAESTTTTPPAACCDRLESLIVNNVSCVCLLFGNEDVVQALQLDVAKALTLPPRCGLPPFDLSDNCPASMVPARAPLMSTPNALVSGASEGPSQSPSPSPGGEAGRASNIAWTGSTIMASLLLLANLIY